LPDNYPENLQGFSSKLSGIFLEAVGDFPGIRRYLLIVQRLSAWEADIIGAHFDFFLS